MSVFATPSSLHPGGNPGANLKSRSHRYYLREVAFVWELTKETIYMPLGCLQVALLPAEPPAPILPICLCVPACAFCFLGAVFTIFGLVPAGGGWGSVSINAFRA